MILRVCKDKIALGQEAATQAAQTLRAAIARQGSARIVAAAAASQFEFLESLTNASDIDWACVELFHLDEYVGLPQKHPASFRRFLREHLIAKTGIEKFHPLEGEKNPVIVCREVGRALVAAPVDVAFVGIGENGHLAFNDPPADFVTEEPYVIVELDEACRSQQVGEGWFPTLADVPRRAISISVRQLLKAREIICVVPDARKAQAVKNCFSGEISPHAPASILRTHPRTIVFLDPNSAALLDPKLISEGVV
ncbi:MAG: glucosamine-6-phosphate deaminase [Acidobacteriota bacterium]|nr:glucosamine-6-phosphate deaminase [Acidobacteriota bacterium]